MTSRVLSVSQAETYDPSQPGGCPRRWWFEHVQGLRPEQNDAQTDGDAGHELLARYLTTGERPPKRCRMGKAVTGAILKGELPTPGPHLHVERRFDGGLKLSPSGAWRPVDTERTLWLGGVPWDGFVDLEFRTGATVTVLDHKFSLDIHGYARPAASLIRTVQMPVYALDSMRVWPDARAFRLVHHYVSRRGVESFMRVQNVSVEDVNARKTEIEALVAEMLRTATATEQNDVPFNRRSCSAYTGCPHQSICSAFREKKPMIDQKEIEALFGMDTDTRAAPVSDARFKAPTETEEEFDAAPPSTADMLRSKADAAQDAGHHAEAERLYAEAAEQRKRESADDIPLPEASAPAPQERPSCSACGTELTPENGSKLRDGGWKHIGCPADAREPEPFTLKPAPPDGPASQTCPACPHVAHAGVQCTGKRGRGQCRCGAVQAPPAEQRGGLVQPATEPPDVDAGRFSPEDVERAEAIIREAEAQPMTAAEREAFQAHSAHDTHARPSHPLAGTLRVEFDVSPALASLLERLIAGR